MMRRMPISWLLAGSAIGASTMYFFDPERGRRRRRMLEDRARAAVHDVECIADKAQRDLENRARGLAARVHGSKPTPRRQRRLLQGTPELRLLEACAGVTAAAWGIFRGGLVGFGTLVAGSYVVARAAVPQQDGMIRVQKTITIDAPLEEVFAFWSRFENFPRFMEHVLDVRADGDRSHWRVTGPAGLSIEWDAELVERIQNKKLVWRSLPGSSVEHHGEVHFERAGAGAGATRISIHMAYEPPGGALGHAVAGFLLGDPKRLMDDDLVRLKSLLEEGKATAHHREVRVDELH
jgi:uncharacterized membrane protein